MCMKNHLFLVAEIHALCHSVHVHTCTCICLFWYISTCSILRKTVQVQTGLRLPWQLACVFEYTASKSISMYCYST